MAAEEGYHPPPPPDFGERKLPIVRSDVVWYRIHRTENDCVFFNTSRGARWNAQAGSFGVLYVARQLAGAFVETLCRGGSSRGFVLMSEPEERSCSKVTFDRPLRLVRLTASGLVRMRADNRLTTDPWTISRPWAEAIHAHPNGPDGVLYRSRHDPSQVCAGVFNRDGLKASWELMGRLWPDLEAEVRRLTKRYQIALE
jgi:hypothetical protein